jgi:hypothetical protein
MIKPYSLLILGMFALAANAQTTAPIPTLQPYGKISNEDLELKSCDFEKDANAMVLFAKSAVYYDGVFNVVQEVHRRFKVFNDNGKDVANIHVEFYGGDRSEFISDVQAETVNMVDGKPEITKLDKKLIYTQHIDKVLDELVFTMPNVKAGSVFEYKYRWTTTSYSNFPDWDFQEKIPVRYSELDTEIPQMLSFKTYSHIREPYAKHTTSSSSGSMGSGENVDTYTIYKELRGMSNIHSLPDEPFMSSYTDNLESLTFQLTGVTPLGGFQKSSLDTWPKIGGALADADEFGSQLRRKLANEEDIINKAKALKTDEEKIAYLFNTVKNIMKWNGIDRFYTNDGTVNAWENKTGNSTEINLILFHLLKKSGVKGYPMIVSTREHGKVNPYNPYLYQFNRAVVYIPVDSTKQYILDATGKYNTYNVIPGNLLNSSGFYIDKDQNTYDILFLQKADPVRQVTLITAEIKPDGKMSGTVQLNSFSYNRISAVKSYKTDGEEKYIKALTDGDNDLKITSLKFDNMEVDTLPLTQNIQFNLDLTGSDENYIYFKPNLFASNFKNDFLSENRYTDIDFGYQSNDAINGTYKIPTGYKVDAMPKSVSMAMTDKSIVFKRMVAEQEGSVVIRYVLYFKKSIYFKEDYPEIHDFFKKLNEMMNEQIVLKKG